MNTLEMGLLTQSDMRISYGHDAAGCLSFSERTISSSAAIPAMSSAARIVSPALRMMPSSPQNRLNVMSGLHPGQDGPKRAAMDPAVSPAVDIEVPAIAADHGSGLVLAYAASSAMN